MNKRGQLFLLAAVILASIIITLGATINYARVNKEDKNFYDTTYDIKREGLEVVNYGVISGNVTEAVADYSNKVGDYLADSSPDTEILFIYGNSTDVYVENYGKGIASIGSGSSWDSSVGCNTALVGTIQVSVGGASFDTSSSATAKNYYGKCSGSISRPVGSSGDLSIIISNVTYNFTLGNDQKFIIVTKKLKGNETYMDIK